MGKCARYRYNTRTGLVRAAVAAGDFRADLDHDQFFQDLHGIMLACHHATRLLHDPDAGRRARLAFAALVERARGHRASG